MLLLTLLLGLTACQKDQTASNKATIKNLQAQNDSLRKEVGQWAKFYNRENLVYDRDGFATWGGFAYEDSLQSLILQSYSDTLANQKRLIRYFIDYPYDTLVTEAGKIKPLSLTNPDFEELHNTRIYPFLFFPDALAWYSARIHPNGKARGNNHSDKDQYLANSQHPRQQLIYAFIHRFDRSPKHLEAFFRRYEQVIFALIDKKVYKRMGIDSMVEGLLEAHSYLMKNDHQKIFAYLDTHPKEQRYYFLKTKQAREFIRFSKAVTYFKWPYTFWYRRYLEGNMEVVYKILLEVNKHYGD